MKSRVDRAGKKVWSSTWEGGEEKKSVIALCNCTIAYPPPTKSLEPVSFPSMVCIAWLRPFWWNVESSRNLFPQISRYIFPYIRICNPLLNTWFTLSSIIHRSHQLFFSMAKNGQKTRDTSPSFFFFFLKT